MDRQTNVGDGHGDAHKHADRQADTRTDRRKHADAQTGHNPRGTCHMTHGLTGTEDISAHHTHGQTGHLDDVVQERQGFVNGRLSVKGLGMELVMQDGFQPLLQAVGLLLQPQLVFQHGGRVPF